MISVPLILLGHWRGNGLAILCDPGIPLAPKALGVEVEATPSSWKHSTRKFCCEAYMAHIGLQFESESSRIEGVGTDKVETRCSSQAAGYPSFPC